MKFLTLEKEVFGLDISDQSLKIVSLKKRSGGFSLASFNEIEIDSGVIEKGIIQDEEALVKIIKALYKNTKGERIRTKYVIASLPEERSFLQVIQMPKMEEKELKSAVFFEAENYIPLPITEVYLDFQTIDPIKDHFNHLDVLIAATPKKIVNSYVSCLKKAGLVPVALEVESQAIARSLIKKETSISPVIIIDIGKTSAIFIVFAGHSIQFTCSIPISSLQLTSAIAKSLAIDPEKAERIKIKYDLASREENARSKKIFEAMLPILEELVVQVKKYSNFYQDHSSHEHLPSNHRIENVLICGGGANLKGLPEFLSEKLQIPVTLGNFWTNLQLKKTHDQAQQNPLSFTTALGLALRGAKNTND
ncbi:MAG: hypothetical protein A2908_03275 [Candidatus Staskawiczbacteria bacterium RIFCSPLOWO2_01_FULL_38_12b]|uniref:SHS2 domain-containing protein n=1 Tax=Candidatus Staskawiczbacteria bacterium RIFCSPLOWO2_01_FULL_38_12b TaxID=1802214 RepID=A0A1G2ID73_9BACT|nr:MAG: hypothetical protein A2908_03275 [Candidatus Staskawiczbacteria bacterium RIFCSPLOWO2_01_FULL_38_12b]